MKQSKRQVNDRFVIDLNLEEPERDHVCQKMSPVSIILGAGFSAPAGYPLGEQMNRKLLEFDFPVAFLQSGVRVDATVRLHPEAYQNIYQETFVYCKRLISWYKKNYTFDYEEFYDILASGQFKEFGDDSLFEGLSTINRNCGHLRPSVLLVYTQMVLYLLKDKNGQSFYDDRELDSNIISCYYSFMRLVSELRRESVVNVHTLNHDLLFEALAKTESVWGRVSDGFDEYGSEYFGKLRIGNNSYYCCLD